MTQVIVRGKYTDNAGRVWEVVGADFPRGVRAQHGGEIREFPWWDFVGSFTPLTLLPYSAKG